MRKQPPPGSRSPWLCARPPDVGVHGSGAGGEPTAAAGTPEPALPERSAPHLALRPLPSSPAVRVSCCTGHKSHHSHVPDPPPAPSRDHTPRGLENASASSRLARGQGSGAPGRLNPAACSQRRKVIATQAARVWGGGSRQTGGGRPAPKGGFTPTTRTSDLRPCIFLGFQNKGVSLFRRSARWNRDTSVVFLLTVR